MCEWAILLSPRCFVQERSRRRLKRSIRRHWSFSSDRLYASHVRCTAILARSCRGPRTRRLSTSAGRDSECSEPGRGCTSPTFRRPTQVATHAKLPTALVLPASRSTSTLSVSRLLRSSWNFRKTLYVILYMPDPTGCYRTVKWNTELEKIAARRDAIADSKICSGPGTPFRWFHLHLLCGATLFRLHHNHSERLRRVGNNSGPIFRHFSVLSSSKQSQNKSNFTAETLIFLTCASKSCSLPNMSQQLF